MNNSVFNTYVIETVHTGNEWSMTQYDVVFTDEQPNELGVLESESNEHVEAYVVNDYSDSSQAYAAMIRLENEAI